MTEAQQQRYLQWMFRVVSLDTSVLPATHKLVIVVLQRIFLTHQKEPHGYLVIVGKLPADYNLIGATGLSESTVRLVISELVINDLVRKWIAYGTPEENFADGRMYLIPTEKWRQGHFNIQEKSVRRKRIPRCPHCKVILRMPHDVTMYCNHCGSLVKEIAWEEEGVIAS